jgi:anti-anti-sigma regulatory factor
VDLDLGGVGFFDASGIAFLGRIRNLCVQRRGACRITAASEPVRYVLALVGVGEVFSSS